MPALGGAVQSIGSKPPWGFLKPQARALHFLIVPFSTTVPSAPPQTFSVVQGRGHTMLQRMQQFGLVKAILLDDLPADGQKGTGKALTTVWTQLSAPCGRGACRTFSTQQGKRPNRVQIACVLRQLVSHAHTHSRWSISCKSLLRQTKSLLCGILASEHHDRFLATRMFGEKSGHVQHLR